ncbi:MAG: hypothetical protein NT062_28765 [Proteobacteria bacterium]|nr:hypothetical protein [Pseudomonadota bacterium]
MAESQILTVIRMWAAVAWADGVLAESEADGLRRLVRTAELTDEERVTAAKIVETPTKLEDIYLTELSPDARRGIYRAAVRMALVDHVIQDVERDVLRRMQVLLAIPVDVAAEIEHDVPGFHPA